MNQDRIYRYCLTNPLGSHALSWDRMVRDHRFSIPYDLRTAFHEIMCIAICFWSDSEGMILV